MKDYFLMSYVFMHLVIILPAYNEGQVLGEVLDSLPKNLKKVTKITPLVINDNSTDDTPVVARAHGAKCISHSVNLGAGGATVTGFEAAKKMKADIIVTLDADGQHDPADIANLIRPITNKGYDVVIGSRLLRISKNMPAYRRFGNWGLNLITYLFFQIWVTDSQSGFKAFSRNALNQIKLSTVGYEFCSEIIGEIKRLHLKYKEVPISTIYTKYSKLKGQHALNAINIIFGLMLRNLR